MKLNAVSGTLLVLLMSWGLFACAPTSDSSSSTSSSSSSSTTSSSSSCSGSQTPYGDIQIDSQCQAACAYLEAGSTEGVDATCSILVGWESHTDIRATDCPACGNTSSSTTSTDSSSWNLCTRETSTSVYSQCGTGSCSSGYSLNSTYSSQSSCESAATAWRNDASTPDYYTLCTRTTSTMLYYQCEPQGSSCPSGYSSRGTYSTSSSCGSAGDNWLYSKPSAKLADGSGLSPVLKSMATNWKLCVDYQDVGAVCSTDSVCAESSTEQGNYASSDECAQSAEAWLSERQYTQPTVSVLSVAQPKDSAAQHFSIFSQPK